MVKVKYFSNDYEKLEKIEGRKSDWIDLRVDSIVGYNDMEKNDVNMLDAMSRSSGTFHYNKGDVLFLGLGVAMELPAGHEAYIVPRSSTFKKTGLLLTNGIGIIDNAYKGDNDEWKVMVYATRDGKINRHDRLFQFRIQKIQSDVEFKEVERLGNKDRGGYGSTDKEDYSE